MSDPVVVVQMDCKQKQKQQTRILKKNLNPVFDQMLVFEFKDLEPLEVEATRIKVSVMDANTFTRNALIGAYFFDMGGVYYNQHHEIFRQWVALTDVTDEREGIQGYLKLSIVVLGPDDEQHTHSAEEEDDEGGDGMLSVLMPPSIEQKGMILKCKVFEVDGLPKMDEGFFGGAACDPFARIDFAGVKVKSSHKKGQDDIQMLEELQVPVMEPIMGSRIMFSMYDWDAAGSNDRICSTYIDYNEVKRNGYPPRWINFYGAPEGKQRGLASKMNRGYIEGSFFRGRALISMEVEECPEPQLEVAACNGLLEHEKVPERQYSIQVDLYEGSEIPDKGDMHVEVSCGRNYFSSKTLPVESGTIKFYEEIKNGADDIVVSFPVDTSQVPLVFVYLCTKKKRISYTTFEMSQLMEDGWSAPPQWHSLKEDRALDALDGNKGEFPGALLFSIRGGPTDTCPDEVPILARPLAAAAAELEKAYEAKIKAESGGIPDSKVSVKGQKGVSSVGSMVVEVIEGRNMPLADRTSCDPYMKFKIDKQKYRTKTIKSNRDPMWNETFTFEKIHIDSRLEMTLMDQDFTADDLLGESQIHLRSLHSKSGTPHGRDFKFEDWFMTSDKHPKAQVRLRITFKYLPFDQSQAVLEYQRAKAERKSFNPFKKKKKRKIIDSVLGVPEEETFVLRAHIYQARGLPATDDSGLADPYVICKLRGKSIKTETRQQTLNPTWYKTLAVNVELPQPLDLAPDLQVYVYDHDQFSADDPIGRFRLDVEEAMHHFPAEGEIKPMWFDLRDWDDKVIAGAQILCAFQLLTVDQAEMEVPDITPPTIPAFLEVTTLGLRDLESIFGVHKTFIQFELPSGKKFHTIKASVPTPTSPNFLQVIRVEIDVPIELLYAPMIDIEVRDIMFGGFIKRLIGSASLNLADYMLPDEKDPGRWSGAPNIKLLDEDELEAEIAAEREEKQASEKQRAYERAAEEEDAKDLYNSRSPAGIPIHPADRSGVELDSDHELDSARGSRKPLLRGDSSGGSQRYQATDIAGDNGDSIGLGAMGSSSNPDDDFALGLGDIPDAPPGDEFDEKHDENASLLGDEKKQTVAPGEFAKDNYADQMLDMDALPTEAEGEDQDMPPYMKGRDSHDNELEDVMEICPFKKIPLFTGQKNGGPFSRLREVGMFKGLIRLTTDKESKSPLDTKDLMNPQELYVRLYILRGTKLMPKDDDGTSDPYLVVRIGKRKFSLRDKKLRNTLEAEFFEAMELPVTIPGDATVTIEVWDWDGIGDDLIGKTKIDIEDRWFCKEWRKIEKKPVEYRTLKNPTSAAPQGKLEMWMELWEPEHAKREPMVDIKPPPPEPYELRVIVWGVRKVPNKDELTDQSDLYVTCQPSVQDLKKQQTDLHFRAKNGKGNFNWRMKFPILLPVKRGTPWPRLRFQIWDKDFFSANDSICETVMSIKGICKQAMKKKDRVKIFMKKKDRFWIEGMKHPNDTEPGKAKMEISLEMMPEDVATQLPAGFGRGNPNQNPFLPEPEGRFKFDLFSPLKMLRELLGDNLYRKICGTCICMLCMAACFFTAPMIFSQMVSNILI
jgi:C2 domain